LKEGGAELAADSQGNAEEGVAAECGHLSSSGILRQRGEERVIAVAEPAIVVQSAAPPRLSHDELVAAQKQTLSAPRRKYSIAARALFLTLDLVYGKQRTKAKFKVLEIVARVPYQTWEHVAYIAVTHVHQSTGLAKRIPDRIVEARSQQATNCGICSSSKISSSATARANRS